MKYTPGNIPLNGVSASLRGWLADELRRIANAIGPFEFVQVTPIDVEPAKPRAGMIVWAAATDWDPGHGPGLYVYNGSDWDAIAINP